MESNIHNQLVSKVDFLFCMTTKLLGRVRKQILDTYGLTTSQFDMLSAIYYFKTNKQDIIQINLSEKTGIDPMTTSTILRNLEKKKQVVRVRGIENTRVVYVEMTDLGYRIYEEAYNDITSLHQVLYKQVNMNNLAEQLRLLSDELLKINN